MVERKEITVKSSREIAESRAKRLAIEKFWQSVPELERQRLEADVIAAGTKLARDVIERGGPFANSTRQLLLDAYALKNLGR